MIFFESEEKSGNARRGDRHDHLLDLEPRHRLRLRNQLSKDREDLKRSPLEVLARVDRAYALNELRVGDVSRDRDPARRRAAEVDTEAELGTEVSYVSQ